MCVAEVAVPSVATALPKPDWASATTDINWINTPASDQIVNSVTVAGFERMLLTTGSGNDNIDNTGGLISIGTGSVLNQFGSSIAGGTVGGNGSWVVFGSSSNFASDVTLTGRMDMTSNASSRQRRIDPLHAVRHFAEPHDLRPQGAGRAAGGAGVVRSKIVAALANVAAGLALDLQQFAVHVDQIAGPGGLVEVVDVLRDEAFDLARVLELRERGAHDHHTPSSPSRRASSSNISSNAAA